MHRRSSVFSIKRMFASVLPVVDGSSLFIPRTVLSYQNIIWSVDHCKNNTFIEASSGGLFLMHKNHIFLIEWYIFHRSLLNSEQVWVYWNPIYNVTRTRFVQTGKIEIDTNERAVIGKIKAAFSFASTSILSLMILIRWCDGRKE